MLIMLYITSWLSECTEKGIQKIPGKPIGDEKNPFTNRISLREKKIQF